MWSVGEGIDSDSERIDSDGYGIHSVGDGITTGLKWYNNNPLGTTTTSLKGYDNNPLGTTITTISGWWHTFPPETIINKYLNYMNFDTYIGPNGQVCVRPKNNGSWDNEHFLRQLEMVARVPKFTGTAVVNFLGEYIARAMGDGMTVTIDGLGTFAPSLKVNKDTTRTKLDGNVVELNRITFRPHPDLKRSAAQRMTTHRVKASYRRNLNLPDIDQRKEILLNLLRKKTFISSSDYMRATHISRSRAYEDLAEFEKGGVVKVYHAGRNKMYGLP